MRDVLKEWCLLLWKLALILERIPHASQSINRLEKSWCQCNGKAIYTQMCLEEQSRCHLPHCATWIWCLYCSPSCSDNVLGSRAGWIEKCLFKAALEGILHYKLLSWGFHGIKPFYKMQRNGKARDRVLGVVFLSTDYLLPSPLVGAHSGLWSPTSWSEPTKQLLFRNS